MKPMVPTILCWTLFVQALPAQQHEHRHAAGAHGQPRLGSVQFENSGSSTAQPAFLRGLALLHSFEYEDAAAAFREARDTDAHFAVAYWLEAVTHARLLWGIDHQDSARAVLAQLGPTPVARLAKARTARERAYGAAVEALFMDRDQATRARAYADSLRALSLRYPADLDARAFASIALQMAIASDAYSKDAEMDLRRAAIALAQEVFEAQPDHPGAAHYLIHGADHPATAALGLEAARAYAQIAPDAEHALHMPSHIFLQLGLWDDVARSNERAWAASRAWVAQRGRSAIDLDFHAFGWLQYAYLQQGRWRAARALIDSAQTLIADADLAQPAAADARFVVPALQFRYAVETGDWSVWSGDSRANELPGDASQRARYFARMTDYFAAASAWLRGDTLLALARAPALETGSALVKAHAAALRAGAAGNREQAIALWREAAQLEAAMAHSGPPTLLPAHEMLGAALLDAGRPVEAVAAYRQALELMKNRRSALLGLARAHLAAGDREAAQRTYAQLLANLHLADAELPALTEAKRGTR